MKSLVAFFSTKKESPIFIETVKKQTEREKQLAGLGYHTEIEVLPVPDDRLREARVSNKIQNTNNFNEITK